MLGSLELEYYNGRLAGLGLKLSMENSSFLTYRSLWVDFYFFLCLILTLSEVFHVEENA